MQQSKAFQSFLSSGDEFLTLKTKPKNFWGWFTKRAAFKFQLQPITTENFIFEFYSAKQIEQRVKALAEQGLAEQKIHSLLAEELKAKFSKMDFTQQLKLMFKQGVKFPKIVDKTENFNDDEVSFDIIPSDIRFKILKRLVKISPAFAGGVNG